MTPAGVSADGIGNASAVSDDNSGSGYVESEYKRDSKYISDRITADGSSGWPVEAGRYRLVIARACPWANRAAIVRRLLGLEPVISMGICGPTHDERSWTFDLDPGGRDPVLGIERLQEAFFARFPDYERGITVPARRDNHRARLGRAGVVACLDDERYGTFGGRPGSDRAWAWIPR